jgi:hypothetical protein
VNEVLGLGSAARLELLTKKKLKLLDFEAAVSMQEKADLFLEMHRSEFVQVVLLNEKVA